MADHGVTLTDLPADGERVDVSKFSKVISVAGAVGAVTLICSLGIIFFGSGEFRKSFSYSWLFACYFFFTRSRRYISKRWNYEVRNLSLIHI